MAAALFARTAASAARRRRGEPTNGARAAACATRGIAISVSFCGACVPAARPTLFCARRVHSKPTPTSRRRAPVRREAHANSKRFVADARRQRSPRRRPRATSRPRCRRRSTNRQRRSRPRNRKARASCASSSRRARSPPTTRVCRSPGSARRHNDAPSKTHEFTARSQHRRHQRVWRRRVSSLLSLVVSRAFAL